MENNTVKTREERRMSIFEKRELNMMKWVSFWRKNPHRFAAEYLDINLFFFQKIIIYMMNLIPNTKYIAARAQGKSYLTAVYIVIRAILYPGTKIVLASKTKNQAALIIKEKIVTLMNDHPAIAAEIIDIKTGDNNAGVKFKNGSTVTVSAAADSGRGSRANVLIVDEYGYVNYDMLNDVLRPMAGVPRVPKFKNKYPKKYEDYVEPNIEIMISSARYKSEWSYGEFEDSLEHMMENYEDTKHFVCAIPYQASILHGILEQDFIDNIIHNKSFDRLSFQMEWQALFVGENANSYFKFEPINSNRELAKAFIPPTDLEYIENKKRSNPKQLTNMKKQSGEIRLVGVDVALVGGKTNDTTVFTLMRMLPSEGGYKRHVVRIESVNEATTDTNVAIRLKQLFYDFEADYAVLDAMGIGDSVYMRCAEVLYDKNRDVDYPAWESINDKDFRDRIKNDKAERVLFTIKASAPFNTMILTNLRSSFDNGKLKLLQDDLNQREHLIESNPDFLKMEVYEQHSVLEPFQQTTALVNELISLTYDFTSGNNIRVKTENGGTKDRYSSLAYTNFKAHEIELERSNKGRAKSYSDYMFEFNWRG